MSRVTKHVGFGLTYATTFMHPFYVARLLNSLDHITNGRIAFNVITSQRKADAQNYGFDELMEHGQRYDRMDEFMDVCQALWASVEPDAFEWNRDDRPGRRPGQGARDQSRRQILQGEGPAQRAAVAADRAGADPGRRLAARHAHRGALRRSHLRRAQADSGDGQAARRGRCRTARRRPRSRRRSASSGRRRSWSARPRPRQSECESG